MKSDPSQDESLVGEAAGARKRGNYQTAIDLYTRLLAKYPVSDLYNERANTYSELGNYEFALADLNQAIALNSNDADLFVNRANAHFWTFDFAAALNDYEHALALAPHLRQALNGRGCVYQKIGRHEDAIADFEAAMRADRSYASPYSNCAVSLLKLGNWGLALQYAETANRLHPNDAITLCVLGDALWPTLRIDDALNCYREAISVDPSLVVAYQRVVALLNAHPEWMESEKQSVEFARKACELTEWRDYFCLSAMADACVACGLQQEAVHWQTGAVALAAECDLEAAKARLSDLKQSAESLG